MKKEISSNSDKEWDFEITIGTRNISGEYGDFLYDRDYDSATEDFQEVLKEIFSDMFNTKIDVKVRKGKINHHGV